MTLRTIAPLLLLLSACGPQIALDDTTDAEDGDSTSDTTDGPVTTAPPPATTNPPPMATTTTAGLDTGDVTDDGSTFIADTDSCGIDAPEGTSFHCTPVDCDLFLQDCPQGEKCTVWANDGGSAWNSTRCVPVSDTPQSVGETCTVEGSAVTGIDDCELGALCWDVDPKSLTGTCEAFCSGTVEAPECADGHVCTISSGPLALCLPTCHPLANDCLADEVCVPVNDHWTCTESATMDGTPGSACEFINACGPDTVCAAAEAVPNCEGATGCCSSVCDLAAPDPSAGCLPGQTCISWYAAGKAPAEYETVGVCVL